MIIGNDKLMKETYIYDAVRSPIGLGTPKGQLYEVLPVNLLKACLNAIHRRNSWVADRLSNCIIGCMTPVSDQGGNIGKAALMLSQMNNQTASVQVNKLEGSGLAAIQWADLLVKADTGELVIAGGVESRSRIPIGADQGPSLFKPNLINLNHLLPKGVAADLFAALFGITREELDTFALRSYGKAQAHQRRQSQETYMVPIFDRNGLVIADQDELPVFPERIDLDVVLPAFTDLLEMGYKELALLKYPELSDIMPMHTGYSSAQGADAASLVLIGGEHWKRQYDVVPKARILSVAQAESDPTLSWNGAISAVRKCLEQVDKSIRDVELWECNEPYAAIPLQIMRGLGISEDCLNILGGTLGIGHADGANGAVMVTRLLEALELKQQKTGMVVVSVSQGTGMAMLIERIGY